MFIQRQLQDKLTKRLQDPKAIIIFGPRQVGKSTLLKHHADSFQPPILWWNGDDADIRELLESPSSTKLKTLIGKAKTLVIDEAQRIQNIGICIKIIVDNFPEVKVLATGSSAFELSNRIKEPLTGRKWEYFLFPFSFTEMVNQSNFLEEKRMIPSRMIYGYYPEIVLNLPDAADRLRMIADSYLFKDVFALGNLRKPEQIIKLLQALAYQVGNEVSYHELGMMAGLDNETVEKYITLLEQTFIIFRLGSFSRNLRNELKKAKKVYFLDNGIRNAVIANFNSVESRNDVGALWENYMISERLKFQEYQRISSNNYFWRTYDQQEVDWVEERDGSLFGYEFKWKESKVKTPTQWEKTYPNSSFEVINSENFHNWLK